MVNERKSNELRNITGELREFYESDPDEFNVTLQDYFGHGCAGTPGENHVIWTKKSDDLMLKIDFTSSGKNAGKINNISANLNGAQLKKLKTHLRKSLQGTGRSVLRKIFFSQGDFHQSYRFDGHLPFQILPPPEDYQLTPGGHRPAILEFYYKSGNQDMLERYRIQKRFNHIVWLLHATTQGFFFKYPDNQRQIWTTDETRIPRWSNIGYFPNPPETRLHEFSNFPNQGTIADLSQVVMLHARSEQYSRFPDVMTSFEQLDLESRSRFLTSCYWYHIARHHARDDGFFSMCFIALVGAIESLVPAVKAPRCEKCDTEQWDVSKRFRLFLDKYVSKTDPDYRSIQDFTILYHKRSLMVHKGVIFPIDTPESYSFSPSFANTYHLVDGFSRIVSKVLVKWLLSSPDERCNLPTDDDVATGSATGRGD